MPGYDGSHHVATTWADQQAWMPCALLAGSLVLVTNPTGPFLVVAR